jgi:hypothetical protein
MYGLFTALVAGVNRRSQYSGHLYISASASISPDEVHIRDALLAFAKMQNAKRGRNSGLWWRNTESLFDV